MTEWFRRKSEKIKTLDKREIAEGMWLKCPGCSEVVYRKAMLEQNYVCIGCSHHFRISSGDYINLLVDDAQFEEFCTNIVSVDPLEFVGTKKYADQLVVAKEKTGNTDAVKTIVGKIGGIQSVLAIMDFSFIGGSMGSVVGEKITRAIDKARKLKCPILIITASGGARMQEGAYSLMQMAKISAKLAQFSDEGGLYVTLLTDPTTGGTTASFAMLGDITIAEIGSTIGFAGKRVIQDTIRVELPTDFQKAEYLYDHGMVDMVVHRKDLKNKLETILNHIS